jgi:hypothetical protein
MNYFLEIFIDFFIFWIQIQIWNLAPVATARYRYRTSAVATVTAVHHTVMNGIKPCRSVQGGRRREQRIGKKWPKSSQRSFCSFLMPWTPRGRQVFTKKRFLDFAISLLVNSNDTSAICLPIILIKIDRNHIKYPIGTALRACTALRRRVVCRTSNCSYRQMYRQLIQPIDREASVSCLMLCMEVKINYKCICVYHCVAIWLNNVMHK